MITWTGKSTDGRWVRTVQAEDFRELMDKLIEKGYIPHYTDMDGQLFENITYISPKLDTLNDMANVHVGGLAEQAVRKIENLDWENDIFDKFTDNDFQFIISQCNSQAYYQDFVVE